MMNPKPKLTPAEEAELARQWEERREKKRKESSAGATVPVSTVLERIESRLPPPDPRADAAARADYQAEGERKTRRKERRKNHCRLTAEDQGFESEVPPVDRIACHCGLAGERLWEETGFICARCQRERDIEDARETAARDQAERESYEAWLSDRAAQLRAAGVEEAYHEVPFEEPPVWPRASGEPSFDLREWTGQPWSILFHGTIGSGKSMCAAQLLYLWHQRRRPLAYPLFDERGHLDGWALPSGEPPCGAWITASQLVKVVFDRKREKELARIEGAELLVVDDLGRNHSSPQTWVAIGEIIYQRHAARRPTIATTNLNLEAIDAADAGLCDRLTTGFCVEMTGPSRRRRERPPMPAAAPATKPGPQRIARTTEREGKRT